MAGTWYSRPKWHRWLPTAIFFRIYKKKYAEALLYEDVDCRFVLESKDPFYHSDPKDERIAYLEKVISDNAMVIMANECKESQ